MTTAVDVFLDHHGIKGMQWGVRKSRTSGSSESSNNKSGSDEKSLLSSKQKRAVVIGVVAGAAVAGAVVAHRAGFSVGSLRKTNESAIGAQKARDILSSFGKQKTDVLSEMRRMEGQRRFSAIPMPPVPKASSPRVNIPRSMRSNPSDVTALKASISRTVKLANADLKERDNRLNIPFSQRSYIKDWVVDI